MNLATIIDGHPAEQPALYSRGRVTTYGELRGQVARLRGALAARGVQPGDRVAVIAGNNWYFVVAYLAVLGVGAIAVPLNPQSPPAEIERELGQAEVSLALVGPAPRRTVGDLAPGAVPGFGGGLAISDLLEGDEASGGEGKAKGKAKGKGKRKGEGKGEGEGTAEGERTGEGAGAGEGHREGEGVSAEGPGTEPPVVDREPEDVAVLLFTSGTAGAPRPAMLTHGNLLANLDQVLANPERPRGADEVALGVLPLFHVFGLNAVLGLALKLGGSVVLVERFDPHTTLDDVAAYGVTVMSGVPTMWAALAGLENVDRAKLATVRLAASGAAPLDPEVRRAVRDRLGLDLAEGYGLTEASPVVTTGLGHGAPDGSIGVPLPGVEVRLIDAEGMNALVGDPGEVWVRGPNVFAGYWNDPEATATALTEDGWLRTGDVAVVDDDGFLSLVDRVKDVIVVSGFNVFPAEVEEVLAAHPGVVAAAVVGVPNPQSGEAVKAYVVPVPGAHVEPDELIDHVSRYLARYKCPSTVVFVDELPYGVTGKVLRRTLR
jgi:long-chain acyl-CoA synthetase